MRQGQNDSRRYNKPTILCPNLILVEGPDDFQFIRFLRQRQDLQIHVYEGKSNLQGEIQLLKKVEGFDKLKRVVLMRDADMDPNAALQSVLQQWSNAMSEPLPNLRAETWFSDNTGREWLVWILPDARSIGDLEELLWRTVAQSNHKECVEQFIACLSSLTPPPYGAKTKALLYAWLATQQEPVKQLYAALDSKSNLFDPLHPVFHPATAILDSI